MEMFCLNQMTAYTCVPTGLHAMPTVILLYLTMTEPSRSFYVQ